MANEDDPELRRVLAQLQGSAEGYDFVVSFTDLLKDKPYDLKLTLEFCYFLEIRGLHQAALNVLEAELRKRLVLPRQPDESEGWTISCFFLLLQAQVSIDFELRLQDYERIIETHFPEQIVRKVGDDRPKVDATVIGKELEETEKDYGPVDEILRFTKMLLFFGEHYPVPIAVASISLLLLILTVFRVPGPLVERIGTTGCFLLLAFLLFESLRSLRLHSLERIRAYKKISTDAMSASFALVILNLVGPGVLGSEHRLVSVAGVKAMSLTLVAAVLWRTAISMSAIRASLRKVRADMVEAVARRGFRREIARLVGGTAKWSLVAGWSFGWIMISHAEPLIAAFFAIQTSYLATCWRWSYLEARAEKQRLRDGLAFVIGVAFLSLACIEFVEKVSPFAIAVGLSFDGALLLGVAMTFALQIPRLNRKLIYGGTILFALMNFAPLFEQLGKALSIANVFGKDAPLAFLSTRITDIIFLCVVVLIVVKGRAKTYTSYTKKEVYMESKYKILGGAQGAVGDGATALNFSQTWASCGERIDLSSLADELASLRSKLVNLAKEPDHFAALAELAGAENAARESNGPSALEHIRKAGSWVWDVATKIGIGVATAAAKQAVGL